MSKNKKEKKVRFVQIGIGILVFLFAFSAGVVSKFVIKPYWSKEYSFKWNDEIGTLMKDLAYGDGEENNFDLYLPNDISNDSYGLVVYLHAGGFTTGDKKDDEEMLSWLCSKGYVAAGINYTLRTDNNDANILTQSNEIKEAIPKVIEAAEEAGYHIDKLAMAGGSAGHTLAMIYTYRDGADAPVPVALTFGAVGPSSFYQEDWGIYGLEQDDEACAGMFSIMAGVEIKKQEIKDKTYLEKVKPISAVEWVETNPVPAVVAYGTFDKIQPFLGSLRLKSTLEDNNIDYQYFEMSHSGHALHNDSVIYKQWIEAVNQYLDKYMPVM